MNIAELENGRGIKIQGFRTATREVEVDEEEEGEEELEDQEGAGDGVGVAAATNDKTKTKKATKKTTKKKKVVVAVRGEAELSGRVDAVRKQCQCHGFSSFEYQCLRRNVIMIHQTNSSYVHDKLWPTLENLFGTTTV